MKTSLLVLMAIVVGECVERYSLDKQSTEEIWQSYKNQYNLHFDNETERRRFEIFSETLASIETHNAEYEAGNYTYYLGLNQFAHLMLSELNFGYESMPENISTTPEILSDINAPDSFDWRQKGAVTSVKNQGECQSCWAFSTVAALETAHKVSTGQLVSLSEQQLVDCDKGNRGCEPSRTDLAIDYMKKNGIQSDKSYPYVGKVQKCQFNKASVVAKCTGYKKVAQDENQMKQAVTINALVAGIRVTQKFITYKGGFFEDPTCSSQSLHAITIIGYGSEKGKDYWIVKNSWATTWGNKGYATMARNVNICGIKSSVLYPTV